MPTNKDLKRLVRSRMRKTGEAYTAARAQLLKKPSRTASPATPPTAPDYAALAGMADEKVAAKTGRGWAEWVRLLDGHGALTLPHRDIARLVSGEYGTPDWWTQTVAVGYERIKGLRARGQRRDGTYEASRSRTFNVSVGTLFDAWSRAATRRRWLGESGVTVRTASKNKYLRLAFTDGTVVVVGFTPKGRSKSAVAVQHTKLPDRTAAEGLKRYWTEKLDQLGALLRGA